MSYIVWLDSADASPARAGGKGASLARLGAAGFPVPPGFAVTVDAYWRFHETHGLTALVEGLASLPERPAVADVRAACEPFASRLAEAALPNEIADAVGAAFHELRARTGEGATFAVRSSGVSEDSAGASFAGLYESYLNLHTAHEVLDAIQKCYDCLWQPRAVQYRALKKIDHGKEAMAVVVMQTVPSEVSGVAFSLNPVTGAHDEVVINASWGLGEAVVSGLVTPDNYVARKDGALLVQDVFEKHVRVVAVPSGTMQEETPQDLVTRPALDEAQIAQVATTVAEVEQHYGCPIDVEFAFDSAGRLYLLQARPITTR
ncbi:MAG TPA: PEP/pyruvate-binding domain-containing protein [Tepidiformaceae bacterium]|nr:PEP/pyruvate-binding domain-containing protein [Tepidiformaceae bacterium]